MNLWAANPHQFGPGKLHIVDDEDSQRTLCGKRLDACPGKPLTSGQPSCKICCNALAERPERKKRQAEYEQRRLEQEALKAEEKREWFRQYDLYLNTPQWRERSRTVLKRAGYVCEGCGVGKATQAHHLTYEHVGDEFLWELRAVCVGCHERFHASREAR